MSVSVPALTPVEEMAVSVSVVVALATDANSAILVDRGGGLASLFFVKTDEKPRGDIIVEDTGMRNAAALVQHTCNATAADGIINAFHGRAITGICLCILSVSCSAVLSTKLSGIIHDDG